MLKSIHFYNYKGLGTYTIHLRENNILVGKNNGGKSTVIESLRLLSGAMRKPLSRRAESIEVNGKSDVGYKITKDHIPSVVLNNVRTNYLERDSKIRYKFLGGKEIEIIFPVEGGCYLIPYSDKQWNTPKMFGRAFDERFVCIPILSRLEEIEGLLNKSYVLKE